METTKNYAAFVQGFCDDLANQCIVGQIRIGCGVIRESIEGGPDDDLTKLQRTLMNWAGILDKMRPIAGWSDTVLMVDQLIDDINTIQENRFFGVAHD